MALFYLGNCWFLASIGALTFHKSILKQVVPLEQSFDEDYCGLFHFRVNIANIIEKIGSHQLYTSHFAITFFIFSNIQFWRFGKWMDIIIDDKLPTIDGRLIFVQSKTPTEFWPALLEKAYAKYEKQCISQSHSSHSLRVTLILLSESL